MSQLLRSLTRNATIKTVALLIAGFFWVVAVLDRTYDVRVVVPVTATGSNTKQVITDIDTKSTVVTLEGKGRDLLGVKPRQLAFRLEVPSGKVGSRQLQLSPAALKLPPDVRVRALDPDNVELKVGAAASRMVDVQVPTKGQPPGGMMLSVNDPPAQVKLSGSDEDLKTAPVVMTETIDLTTVTALGRRRLKVVTPESGRYTVEPDSVDVVIGQEKEAARILLGLPVTVTGSEAQRTDIDPTEAQIAVAGPASKMDSLKQSDITIQVRVSGLSPGDYQLAPEIKLPPGFRLVKSEPQLFDVTVK